MANGKWTKVSIILLCNRNEICWKRLLWIKKYINKRYKKEIIAFANTNGGKIIGLKRIDTRDYPEYSLRETLLNAVIHRSYYFDSSIMVALYDDKFEIVSKGGLIDGITIKEIFKGISSSRNPNLANIFYRLGYVESFGTGVGELWIAMINMIKKQFLMLLKIHFL